MFNSKSTNKSSLYGYYGGVSGTNHYIPPQLPDFDPQPPTKPPVVLPPLPPPLAVQQEQGVLQPLPIVSHGLQSSLKI